MAEEPDSLAETFWSVARQLRHLSRDALAPWDVSPSQVRALRVLNRHGAIRLSELADYLRIAPRSVTEVVDDLEAAGLAERRSDPSDRRATLVALSARGTELAETVAATRATEAERFFARITPTDRANLTRILRKLEAE